MTLYKDVREYGRRDERGKRLSPFVPSSVLPYFLPFTMSFFRSLSSLVGAGGAASQKPTQTRAEKARTRVDSLRTKAPVAKSVAHQGVQARPMDAQLSRILDQKRASMQAGGTSAARLGQRPEEPLNVEEEPPITEGDMARTAMTEANSKEEKATRATSASRLKTPATELGLKTPPKVPEPGDMEI